MRPTHNAPPEARDAIGRSEIPHVADAGDRLIDISSGVDRQVKLLQLHEASK
jgi:hypothetical protein